MSLHLNISRGVPEMPLTKTGKKVKAKMKKSYGEKKGENVFYATMNKAKKQWHRKSAKKT